MRFHRGNNEWDPHANAVNSRHHERTIPVDSFRTDEWDWPEAPYQADGSDAQNEHRQAINRMRDQARRWAKQRLIDQAKYLLESQKATADKE